MPETVNGLPVHLLLVHAVVVLVPLWALLVVVAAAHRGTCRRLGASLPALALGCVLLVPVTVSAGRALRHRLGGGTDLVARHAELGGRVLPWVVALAALTAVVWWRGRGAPDPAAPPDRPRQRVGAGGLGAGHGAPSRGAAQPAVLVQVVVVALSAVVAVGTVVAVARTGESGARAVWSDVTGTPS